MSTPKSAQERAEESRKRRYSGPDTLGLKDLFPDDAFVMGYLAGDADREKLMREESSKGFDEWIDSPTTQNYGNRAAWTAAVLSEAKKREGLESSLNIAEVGWAEQRAKNKELQEQLYQATSEWQEEKKRARESEERIDLLDVSLRDADMRVKAFEQACREMAEALKFYGEFENWCSVIGSKYNIGKIWTNSEHGITMECGARARVDLEKHANLIASLNKEGKNEKDSPQTRV